MELEKEAEALSPEEQAFFESEGEKEVTAEVETTTEEVASAEAAAVEKAATEQRERDEKGKFVPHGALHAEREEHKKTRSELNEIREKWARLEERFNAFSQAKPAEQQEEAAPPDPDQDIFGALRWANKQIDGLKGKLSEKEQIEQQTAAEREADVQIWSAWEQDTQQYKQENPDFQNAAKWLAENRARQLKAFGVVDQRFQSEHAINQQIDAELKGIIVAAKQSGMSSAEAVYQMAVQYGYAPANQQQADPNKEVLDKLDKLEQAQQAGRTVGQAAGKGGGDEITAETLLSMPEGEFNAWMSVPANAKRFQSMMGG